jgi:hypothetical protein
MTERAEHRLGRREVLLGAGVMAGGVAATGLTAAPAAAHGRNDDHDDNHGHHNRHDLFGSWMVTRHDDPPGDTTPVRAVFSFAAGDVFVEHDISPAGPPFTGTWTEHGHEFRSTSWSGFPGGPNGGPGPSVRVRLRGTRHHNTISGTYVATVFDPAGNEVDTSTGSFMGVPIEA